MFDLDFAKMTRLFIILNKSEIITMKKKSLLPHSLCGLMFKSDVKDKKQRSVHSRQTSITGLNYEEHHPLLL